MKLGFSLPRHIADSKVDTSEWLLPDGMKRFPRIFDDLGPNHIAVDLSPLPEEIVLVVNFFCNGEEIFCRSKIAIFNNSDLGGFEIDEGIYEQIANSADDHDSGHKNITYLQTAEVLSDKPNWNIYNISVSSYHSELLYNRNTILRTSRKLVNWIKPRYKIDLENKLSQYLNQNL